MASKKRPAPAWQVILEDMQSLNRMTIEAVEGTREALERRIDVLDRDSRMRDAALEAGLRAILTRSEQHSVEIRELQVRVQGNSSDIRQLQAEVHGNSAEIRQLQLEVRGNSAEIRQLQAEVLGNSVGLRELKGQVETLIRLEERVAVLEKPGN